jgi:zinc transport system substrate-binding protein
MKSRLHRPFTGKDVLKIKAVIVPLLLCFLFFQPFEPAADAASVKDHHTPLPVFVSIPPQAYFVKAIGKDWVTLSIMVTPGHSPATYEPTPKQLAQLGKARLYFRIGVPFETVWMKRVSEANRELRIVDTARGVNFLPMKRHYHDEGVHDHGGRHDPHIWLSIKAVKVQARNIHDALVEEDPEHAPFYKQNLEALMQDLDLLDGHISEKLAQLNTRKFIAFHPAWGYFARDYGLEQIPIELEGKRPSAKSLNHLIELAREENISLVVVQKQFSTDSAKVIADTIGAKVIQLDPLDENYPANIKRIADTFREAMK